MAGYSPEPGTRKREVLVINNGASNTFRKRRLVKKDTPMFSKHSIPDCSFGYHSS